MLGLNDRQRVEADYPDIVYAVTEVSVRDLPLMADIGINPDEVGQRQPLIVTVVLKVRPVLGDWIGNTVDYRTIVSRAEALAQERISLIEEFARRLGHACLALDHVLEADIRIDKPRALAKGMANIHLRMVR